MSADRHAVAGRRFGRRGQAGSRRTSAGRWSQRSGSSNAAGPFDQTLNIEPQPLTLRLFVEVYFPGRCEESTPPLTPSMC